MRVDIEEDIIRELQQNDRLMFGEIKSNTGYRGHDVRKSLHRLLKNDNRVYVHSVEDKQKYYALNESRKHD